MKSSQSKPFKIEKSEWHFVLVVVAVVLFLTSLPYIFAYLTAPTDKQFMGIMLDVPDHGQYFSWMRELSQAPLASNKLTAEPNEPVFFNLLWWGLGQFQNITNLSFDATFQIFRISSGLVFLLSGYFIIARFLEAFEQRRTAFLIFTFSSGFGWVLVFLKYTVTGGVLLYPLDVFIAEGNTFLGILAYPHFIAAALYTLVFIIFLECLETEQMRYAISAGLLAQFLGWQHAYDLVLVYGILSVFVILLFLQARKIIWFPASALIVVGLLSFWPALYSVLLTSLDPLWGEVLAQFDNAGVFTPNLLHLPILMGPAFLMALMAFVLERPTRLHEKRMSRLFLLVWFATNFLLIYIPTDFQIHLLNGWQIPIAILATIFVYDHLIPRLAFFDLTSKIVGSIRKPGIVALIILFIVTPTNIYLWSWRFVDLGRYDYPFYLHQDEIRGLEWLDESTLEDDVVLSSLTIGQFIPAWSGNRAYLAHWAQTLDFYSKRDNVAIFFQEATSPVRREQILREASVDYVFFGPAERALGKFQPGDANFLTKVYTHGVVDIYAISHEQ